MRLRSKLQQFQPILLSKTVTFLFREQQKSTQRLQTQNQSRITHLQFQNFYKKHAVKNMFILSSLHISWEALQTDKPPQALCLIKESTAIS